MKKHILTIIIVAFSITAYSQNCNEIGNKFYNYQQAIKLIKTSDFAFTDKCNTSKSSWIIKAEYYSCDDKKGFFIIQTKRKTYIHKNLPKRIWYQFKNATSFGKFYNAKIKKKYQLMF